MIRKELNFQKPFWVIARTGDPKGYQTGEQHMKTVQYEFDNATELMVFLGDMSVEVGESMGDFVFSVIGKSHSDRVLNHLVEDEEMNLEMQKEKGW